MPDNNRNQIRNPIARAAILRKGCVHDKTNKAKRQKQKQAFKKDIRAGKFGSYLFVGSNNKYWIPAFARMTKSFNNFDLTFQTLA